MKLTSGAGSICLVGSTVPLNAIWLESARLGKKKGQTKKGVTKPNCSPSSRRADVPIVLSAHVRKARQDVHRVATRESPGDIRSRVRVLDDDVDEFLLCASRCSLEHRDDGECFVCLACSAMRIGSPPPPMLVGSAPAPKERFRSHGEIVARHSVLGVGRNASCHPLADQTLEAVLNSIHVYTICP